MSVAQPISRKELIDLLVDYRMNHWDADLQEDAIRYGRIGFADMSDHDLQQYAFEELDGAPEYTILEGWSA